LNVLGNVCANHQVYFFLFIPFWAKASPPWYLFFSGTHEFDSISGFFCIKTKAYKRKEKLLLRSLHYGFIVR